MSTIRSSLEQWHVLQAVVDCGGYAQAAEQLHRSQSSVSYTVSKLQEQLGIPLLYIDGRKARLTEAGEVLLQHSRQLVRDAAQLECLAGSLKAGREAEVRLVVDVAFPTPLLMAALKRFAPISAGTHVQLNEVVLSGADEALQEGRADLAIAAQVPQGFLGDPIAAIEFVAVAHPEHPLHQLDRAITGRDLQREMQVVIRDSGLHRRRDTGWLGAEQRWTVTRMETAIAAISSGLGFGWLPRHQILDLLADGVLKLLPLREGQSHAGHLYLIFGQPENVGPATQQLAEIFRQVAGEKETALAAGDATVESFQSLN